MTEGDRKFRQELKQYIVKPEESKMYEAYEHEALVKVLAIGARTIFLLLFLLTIVWAVSKLLGAGQ